MRRLSLYLLCGVDDFLCDNEDNIADIRYTGHGIDHVSIPSIRRSSGFFDKIVNQHETVTPEEMRDIHIEVTLRSRLIEILGRNTYERSGYDTAVLVPAQLFIYHNAGSDISNVCGYLLDSINDKLILYALAALGVIPEWEEETYGYRVLPSIPLNEDNSVGAAVIDHFLNHTPSLNAESRNYLLDTVFNLADKKRLIENGQNYKYFDFADIIKIALYVLNSAGYNFCEEELKLILCWHWS